MTADSRPAFDLRRLRLAPRRPLTLVVAVAFLLAAALVYASFHLRDSPDDPTPVFLIRLGNTGFVPLHGEGSDFWPGNRAWVDGHPETAIREWSKLVEKEGATEAALQALMNIGDVSFARGDRQAAFAAYTKAVGLPVPESMTIFWHNEKHDACATLSDIYLDCGNLHLALKYAELALSPHGFSDPCGVASLTKERAFERRIADLKTAIATRRPVRGETPEQASKREFGLVLYHRHQLK